MRLSIKAAENVFLYSLEEMQEMGFLDDDDDEDLDAKERKAQDKADGLEDANISQ